MRCVLATSQGCSDYIVRLAAMGVLDGDGHSNPFKPRKFTTMGLFSIDINNEVHQRLMVRLHKREVKLKIVRHHGTHYTLDTVTHEDYSKAKDEQIRLDELGFRRDVPCV